MPRTTLTSRILSPIQSSPLNVVLVRTATRRGTLRLAPSATRRASPPVAVLSACKTSGVEVTSAQAVQEVLMRHGPGARLQLRIVRRNGEPVQTAVNIEEDPRLEIVPAENVGATVSPEQRQARLAWLASRRQ